MDEEIQLVISGSILLRCGAGIHAKNQNTIRSAKQHWKPAKNRTIYITFTFSWWPMQHCLEHISTFSSAMSWLAEHWARRPIRVYLQGIATSPRTRLESPLIPASINLPFPLPLSLLLPLSSLISQEVMHDVFKRNWAELELRTSQKY